MQGGFQEFHYSASLGGSHLFDFFPYVVYCWDGATAAVVRASTTGWEDPGVLLGTLDALGFDAIYNAADQRVELEANRATFIGDFEITYDLISFFDKLGFKEKLEDYAQKKLAAKLAKVIEKHGYAGPFAEQLQEQISSTTAAARDEIADGLKKVLRALPDWLASSIQQEVLNQVDDIFETWNTKVNDTALRGTFDGWTAHQITEYFLSTFFAQLTELTTLHFSVWTPKIVVTVWPDGQVTVEPGGSWNHPALTVQRER